MRIFVAGAAGAVGRRLVPLLVSAGHSVVGLTHRSENSAIIRSLGGEAIVADGLNGEAIRSAVISSKPDVIVHEMTGLKGALDLLHFDRAFAITNRLRTEGTDHLLAAAREAGVKRFIAQSFCGWPYARIGGAIKSEEDPLETDPPRELRRSLEAIKYLERTVSGSSKPEGVVLRYGAFYGPDTGSLDPSMVEQVRRRRVPLVGNGNGWWSFVHVGDAAQATALAIERGRAGTVYNIVDDEPAPVREWLPALAKMLGAKPPLRIPAWLVRILAGEHIVIMMTQARAGSNEKAKRELGWRLEYPSWCQGFAAAVQQVLSHAHVA